VKSAAMRVGAWLARLVDRWLGWHRLPAPVGLLVLLGLRFRLRSDNLVHTSLGLPQISSAPAPACRRMADGTYNDLRYPTMGSAGTPFGRNVPLSEVRPETFGAEQRCTSRPSPRTVSTDLLARREFLPAGRFNLLGAAWIQFMVHDWFSHGPMPGPDAPNEIEIPVERDDPWLTYHGPMRVPPTPVDRTHPPCAAGLGPTFLNTVTHWWDASQLYGSDRYTRRLVRTGAGLMVRGPQACPAAELGKIRMDDGIPRLLPPDPRKQEHPYDRADLTGFNDNWWVGLTLLHALFALEHNAICEHLHRAYPAWDDDDLFAHARLVNAALIAKIHTVEWTPAILDHPTIHVGMRGSWHGLAREGGIYRLLAKLSTPEVRNGIRGSRTEHHDVPYAITEEFVSVYRMHTLLPDQLTFRSVVEDDHAVTLRLADVVFGGARDVVEKHRFSLADVAWSFVLQSAGAITLHNYPETLRALPLPNGRTVDMAALDVFRDRERGVPRYNEFRRLIDRRPVSGFGQLVGREGRDRGWDEELRRVYGDVDAVDLMVGLFAEPKPAGFAFSDSAFRIFLLMAGRRLQSDRFFTTDFTEEVYTPEGLDWIERRSLASVITDHLPELAPHVAAVKNPFHRWDDALNRT
jgi:hypothetical protein